MPLERAPRTNGLNVAQRLSLALGQAKQMGFDVRRMVLEDQQPGWCQVGQRRILFLDLSATTTDQLGQITDILESYRRSQDGLAHEVAGTP
ncbi:hypothetical protein [Roseiconus lacunae]|uniref:Uncharacterized protein n=1 Tax=Roseiconus lacunae TaxID=2605694 RepID=A0ABT7PM44_9BACT|nr:hypothetical protein [Roseiconus lacunae]MCD0460893.1 hypothetical protein [Roseiconus lacunae]MDM4017351.1 hypothetical protein [Roseiconus lacunae]WRQ48737.1 hypothetical protein U8335_17415 [Stieleria sp. HD01]